jgi:hypothetical protein
MAKAKGEPPAPTEKPGDPPPAPTAKAKRESSMNLLDRVALVERRSRRLRWLTVLLALSSLLAIGVAAVALVAPYNAPIGLWLGEAFGRPEEVEAKKTIIEAEQFVLRGPDGKVRATLALRDESAMGLDLYDASGRARAGLDLASDGQGSVWLAAADGQVTAAFNAHGLRVTDPGGETAVVGGNGFTLVDRNQKGRAGLVMKNDDAPSLTLYDGDGRTGALVDVSAEGSRLGLFFGGVVRAGIGHGRGGSQLNLFGDDGRDHATLGLSPDGSAGLYFHDDDGKQRLTLGLGNDVAALSIFDKTEKERADLTLTGDGTPRLQLFDGAGTRRAGLALSPEGLPGLLLEDRGQPRAILGAAAGDAKSGTPGRKPSTSSLLLYDKDGSLVFQAPVY